MKNKNLQENGIVLRVSPIGENNEIILILTREIGLIQAISFGTQKSFKKDNLYSFIISNFTLEKTKNQWRIASFEPFFFGEKIKENIKKFYLGNLFLELIIKSYPSQESYSFLKDSLTTLEDIKDTNLPFLSLQFFYRWLSLQGEEGDLSLCHLCEKPFSNIGFYGTIDQSFICKNCSLKNKTLINFPLNEGIRRYLIFSSYHNINDSLRASLDSKSASSLNLYL